MESSNLNLRYLYFLYFNVFLSIYVGILALSDSDRLEVGLVFNPYVRPSSGAPEKYSEQDIRVLVKLVGTRTDLVLTEPQLPSLKVNSSFETAIKGAMFMPMVAAKLNRQNFFPSNFKIWLMFNGDGENLKYGNSSLDVALYLTNLSNQIFPGTVSSIVLRNKILHRSTMSMKFITTMLPVIREAKLRLKFDTQVKIQFWVFGDLNPCKNIGMNEPSKLSNRLKEILNLVDGILIDIAPTPAQTVHGVYSAVRRISNKMNLCKEIFLNYSPKLGVTFVTSWPSKGDLLAYTEENMIAYWKLMENWSVETNTSLIMQSAFDAPFQSPNKRNVGWWSWDVSDNVEDADYLKEYQFQERIQKFENGSLTNQLRNQSVPLSNIYNDISSNKFNFKTSDSGNEKIKTTTCQEHNKTLHRGIFHNHGVYFNPYIHRTRRNLLDLTYTENELAEMLSVILSVFSNVILASSLSEPFQPLNNDTDNQLTVAEMVARINKNRSCEQKIIKTGIHFQSEYVEGDFSPKEGFYFKTFQSTFSYALKAENIHLGSVEYMIASCCYKNTLRILEQAAQLMYQTKRNHSIKLAIQLEREDCGWDFQRKENMLFENIIEYLEFVENVYVYIDPQQLLEVQKRYLWKGNTASFENNLPYQIVIQEFLNCKETVLMYFPTMQVTLVTSWIPTVGYDGSNKNIINFWYNISDWATLNNETVIFYEAFDIPGNEKPGYNTRGWWKLRNMYNKTVNRFSFISKLEYENELLSGILENSNHTANTSILTTSSLVLISVLNGCALVAILCGLLCCIRYRNLFSFAWSGRSVNNLVKEFYHGKPQKGKSHKEQQNQFFWIWSQPISSSTFRKFKDGTFNIDNSRIICSDYNTVTYAGFVGTSDNKMDAASFKMLHSSNINSFQNMKTFLFEIKLMHVLGNHSNILHLKGLSKVKIEKIPSVTAVFEGSVRTTLQNYIECYEYHKNFAERDRLHKILEWGIQIASGMEFAASKQIFHGNLSSRNVLLTDELVVKLTGFGNQSCSIYPLDGSNGQRSSIVHPAPEISKTNILTEKGDIWSFANVIHECIQKGNETNEQIEKNRDYACRRGCLSNLYINVLEICWHIDPAKRPSFSDVKNLLNDYKINYQYTQVINAVKP